MHSLKTLARSGLLSESDLNRIEQFMLGTGTLSPEAVRRLIAWFLEDLGLDPYYFLTTPADEIGHHILALGVSEMVSRHGGDDVAIQLANEQPDRAMYIVENRTQRKLEVEARMESRYPVFRLECYTTQGTAGGSSLRFYLATLPTYGPDDTDDIDKNRDHDDPFAAVATREFLRRSMPETLKRYRALWEELHQRLTPVVQVTHKNDTKETRVMLGLQAGGFRQMLTGFSHLFHRAGVPVRRKYIEPFADGTFILSFYFEPVDAERMNQLQRELNMVAILPRHTLTRLFTEERFSAQETMYAISAAAFAHQFLSEQAEGFSILQEAVATLPEARGILDTMRVRLAKSTFSTRRVAAAVLENPDTVRLLFQHFVGCRRQTGESMPGCPDTVSREMVEQTLERDIAYHRDRTILAHFLVFNELVLRTNFFRPRKAALSFRLKGGFLDSADFGEDPYGVFFLVGRQFIGFHVRFRDISRGGVRIVRSRTSDAYARNVDSLFHENYNLASTQQKKNKDIPEGGSKGILLLNAEFRNDPVAAPSAFRAYIDAILDLLVPDAPNNGATTTAAAADSSVVDTREVLFLGPDEGSAELMDWAAQHARKRGYPYWKSFTTGKSLSLGGVPHDRYGMTTRSVHTYVTGVLEKLGLEERAVTKIQTGGPDGDLGSNEILISSDITIGVVDGSGVLYDPDGLNREELEGLARRRVMSEKFDRALLGPRGFFVSVQDRDMTLPDGTLIANGEDFRNHFHLTPYLTADLFVPCGGRPAAITVANWKSLLDADGHARVRAIVEGANLFITQEARLRLESAGVIVLKDASTNKGGVTSSSLEVLSGLLLSDEEWDRNMCIAADAEEPPFRQSLVREILERIEHNARAEFELLWAEHQRTGTPFTLLTDEVSRRINRIADAIQQSNLVGDPEIRERVIKDYFPATLFKAVSPEVLQERVPAAYLDALIAARIGSTFLYEYGLGSSEVEFAEYIDGLRRRREVSAG